MVPNPTACRAPSPPPPAAAAACAPPSPLSLSLSRFSPRLSLPPVFSRSPLPPLRRPRGISFAGGAVALGGGPFLLRPPCEWFLLASLTTPVPPACLCRCPKIVDVVGLPFHPLPGSPPPSSCTRARSHAHPNKKTQDHHRPRRQHDHHTTSNPQNRVPCSCQCPGGCWWFRAVPAVSPDATHEHLPSSFVELR